MDLRRVSYCLDHQEQAKHSLVSMYIHTESIDYSMYGTIHTIGKCIASQVNATFFSISASSLTSKWV